MPFNISSISSLFNYFRKTPVIPINNPEPELYQYRYQDQNRYQEPEPEPEPEPELIRIKRKKEKKGKKKRKKKVNSLSESIMSTIVEKDVSNNGLKCFICFNEITLMRPAFQNQCLCKATYCKQCLLKWILNNNNNCPTCRKTIYSEKSAKFIKKIHKVFNPSEIPTTASLNRLVQFFENLNPKFILCPYPNINSNSIPLPSQRPTIDNLVLLPNNPVRLHS